MVAVALIAVFLGATGTVAKPAATAAAAAAAPAPAAVGNLAAPTPFSGPHGCTVKDPTTSGCLTPTTAHALAEIGRIFGGYRRGPVIGSVGCWDKHQWNPTSDHPLGKACDFFPTGASVGKFAAGAGLANGWALANWARANAAALGVHYVIWQGRIWDSVERTGDDPGAWGRSYEGGGVYNAASATGGHFDHVHISFKV